MATTPRCSARRCPCLSAVADTSRSASARSSRSPGHDRTTGSSARSSSGISRTARSGRGDDPASRRVPPAPQLPLHLARISGGLLPDTRVVVVVPQTHAAVVLVVALVDAVVDAPTTELIVQLE